ncbi:nischarin [Venturia canescens]|uniref:nischarin n=1 Tax=Venturia canescens TaxID=32260 RepID=UPI001C9D4C6E|nr:nischarin [Venturia canescens]XP_043268515.1 nischarin [Venturia canescens]XP_043268516.1 nischarin [Venturia canescens]
MACLLSNPENIEITIPSVETLDGVTYYNIEVRIAEVKWKLKHRYNEFAELHEYLVTEHCVEKDILPPKKLIGNKSETFIEKRRIALESYLNAVYHYLKKTMPREFVLFLYLHQYDIFFILQNMALVFFTQGDSLLELSKSYAFTPLQLYAISERLKQPCPPLEVVDRKFDFSHVLDYNSHLKHLTIEATSIYFGTSNIELSTLPIELSTFKSVETLVVDNYPMDKIYGMGNMRDTVKHLEVHNTSLRNIVEFAMCEEVHKRIASANDSHVWLKLSHLDLSNNRIKEIDEAIKLLPHIETLILNNNLLTEISNVTLLPRLSQLHLGSNSFSKLPNNLHTKLGNIVYMDLSQNKLTSLASFSKLYSLEGLDVSCNRIENIEEVKNIGHLPCLENLRLTGNPVSTIVDYRVKVLEPFGKRAADICLDNERPNQKELDTVAVLQALRIAREGKSPTFNPTDSSLFAAEIPST